MARNPYEWLYERQSQPLEEFVLDEVTKVFARAVESFPPEIEYWEREDLRLRYEPVLAQRGRPADRVVRLALKLLRWEILREVEEIDRYLAGGHDSEYDLGPLERETALFLWNHWVNELLSFLDIAQGKFSRRRLLGLVERLESRLLPGPVVLPPATAMRTVT